METKPNCNGIPPDVEIEGELKVTGPDRDEFYEATLRTSEKTLRTLSRSAIAAVAILLRDLGVRN